MGRKHFKKSEKVCRSFFELKKVVIRQVLRFWNGFHGRATEKSGLKHQGSSLESSKIDPFEPKQQDSIPLSTRIESSGSKS